MSSVPSHTILSLRTEVAARCQIGLALSLGTARSSWSTSFSPTEILSLYFPDSQSTSASSERYWESLFLSSPWSSPRSSGNCSNLVSRSPSTSNANVGGRKARFVAWLKPAMSECKSSFCGIRQFLTNGTYCLAVSRSSHMRASSKKIFEIGSGQEILGLRESFKLALVLMSTPMQRTNFCTSLGVGTPRFSIRATESFQN